MNHFGSSGKGDGEPVRGRQNALSWAQLPVVICIVVVAICSLPEWHRFHLKPVSIGSGRNAPQLSSVRQGVTNSSIESRLVTSAEPKLLQPEKVCAALLAAQGNKCPIEQNAAFARVMKDMAPGGAMELLEFLRPEGLKGVAANRLLDRWATADPCNAMLWAQSLQDLDTSGSLMHLVAQRWAVADLAEAASWVRGLSEGTLRTDLMMAVGAEAVGLNPVEALRLATELPTSDAQEDLICRAAAEWAGSDLESSLAWAEQIDDENLKQRVTEVIAVASASQDPAGATRIVLEKMTAGIGQDRAILSILQRMIQTDPSIASAWVSQFPEDDMGKEAVTSMVTLWANQDLTASGNWLSGLPIGPLRNAGILAYSRVLRVTDTQLAERWESSLTGTQ